MKSFSKKIMTLMLGMSLIAGVGAVMFSVSKNVNKVDATPEIGTTYRLVTSTNELVEGANYTIVGINSPSYYALSSLEQQNYRRAIDVYSGSSNPPSSFVSKQTYEEEVMNLKLVKYKENEQDKWALKTTNYYGTNGYLGGSNDTSFKLPIYDTPHSATFSFSGTSAKPWAAINLECEGESTNSLVRYNHTGDAFQCTNGAYAGVFLYKADTSAKDWADDFLATTATPCAESTQDHKEALEAVWNSTVTKYNLLSDADKEILKSATSATENVGAAIERYDTIIKKYGDSSIITNYIDRTISSNSSSVTGLNTTTIIAIISVIAFSSVSAIGICFLVKKFKHK